jgi:lysozyme
VRTNAAGIALIKQFEGVRLKAYKCPAGIWTIGYGHTGPDVREGMEINEREAEQYLIGDLLRFEHGVEECLDGVPASFNQFSAMVSLAYNIGGGAFNKSSVLRYHRQGDHKLAAEAFLLWNKAAGRILPGLTKRRMAERGLYLS